MSAGDRNDLIARARARAEAPVSGEWGYRVALNEADSFIGRWRGETIDEQHDNRRIYLLWDDAGVPCYSRSYEALDREVDRATPQVGATIVIYRGNDYVGQQGTGFSFGIETAPNDAPLPTDDDIPF